MILIWSVIVVLLLESSTPTGSGLTRPCGVRHSFSVDVQQAAVEIDGWSVNACFVEPSLQAADPLHSHIRLLCRVVASLTSVDYQSVMVSMQQEKVSRGRSSASVGSLGGRHGAAFWSEERASGSVGVKLLERMGWQEGRGLGKQEAGTQSFVRAKLKNDTVGIGAKKGAAGDDRQHMFAQATTDMFNALLSKLNAAHSGPQPGKQQQLSADDEGGTAVGEAAEAEEEDTSTAGDAAASIDRYVRKRHLYGRFSRAKDTSLYSHKSKLEIFGRKQTNTQPHTLATHTAAAAAAPASLPPPSISTTTSSVSIQSYFASKMAARQRPEQQQPAGERRRGEADGSAAWQSALFDDISQRSNVGRAGLGLGARASSSSSQRYQQQQAAVDEQRQSLEAESGAAAGGSASDVVGPSSSEEKEKKGKGRDEEEEERERRRRRQRRERKEARKLARQQAETDEQHEEHQPQQQQRDASAEVLLTTEESADKKRQRKKRKQERLSVPVS